MIKLIKLCFACCLTFRATFVEAIIIKEEAYEALKDFDAEVYELLSDPNTASYIDGSRRKAITELLQNNIRKLENTALARAKSITKKAYLDCTIKSQPDYDETLTDLQKF